MIIEEKIKGLLGNPPQHKFSDAKRRELIGRLYKVDEERKTIVDFLPVRPIPAFAAALTTALMIFGYIHFLTPVYPVASGITGTVKVYRSREGRWAPAETAKLRLAKGDIVKTLKDGQADIVVPGVYHMRLKGNSEIKLTRARSRALSGAIGYNLSGGKVFAYYKEGQSQRKPFEIETPEALLSVSGTDFMTETRPGSRKTWVGVLDGAVRVTSGSSVLVLAGEKTIVRQGARPLKPTRLLERELLELEELYRIGEKPQVAILISTGKTRVRELLSFTPLYISSEKESPLPEKIKEVAPIFREAMKGRSKKKHAEAIKKFEEIVKTYPNPKYDVQFLLFIGAYYEYLDEHGKAIDTFKRIIDEYPESGLRSLAQCAIGVIYEEKLKLPEGARFAYAKVLVDYSESPETSEARHGLARLATKR
jgi:tetratricopeptide (TPR) repeat protein